MKSAPFCLLFAALFLVSLYAIGITTNALFMDTTKTVCFITSATVEEAVDPTQPWEEGFYKVEITGIPVDPHLEIMNVLSTATVLLSNDVEEITLVSQYYMIHSQHACEVYGKPINILASIDSFEVDDYDDTRQAYVFPWIGSLLFSVVTIALAVEMSGINLKNGRKSKNDRTEYEQLRIDDDDM